MGRDLLLTASVKQSQIGYLIAGSHGHNGDVLWRSVAPFVQMGFAVLTEVSVARVRPKDSSLT
jgi:hypothetical protein